MLRLFERKLETENLTAPNPVVVRLSSNDRLPQVLRQNEFYLSKSEGILPEGFAGYLLVNQAKNSPTPKGLSNIVRLDQEFSYLEEGDVLRLNPSESSIRILYRKNSPNNYFLITEQCNSFCIMCSQPPRDINDDYRVDEILQTIPLIDKATHEIGLSGGEPTLIGDRLVQLIKQFKYHLPDTALHILTNGRLFSNTSYTQKFEHLEHHDCMFGIPLYSNLPEVHDYIVQAKDAYDQTIKGILNLKKIGQRVEIRVVVHQANYKTLNQLAEFIARNLTFVDQVVFMGLEPTGFAKVNMKALWIDPFDYQSYLEDAIRALDRSKIQTKIYNVQLCLLRESIAHKGVRSISDWKREYAQECDSCTRIDECCGIFGTGTAKRSAHLKAYS